MSEEQKNQSQLIKVTRVTGTAIEFEVDPNEKGVVLGQKIEEKTGVSVNRLILFIKSRPFKLDKTLSEQGIVDGSTLHFSLCGPRG
ncbi:MAG: hypothetical protein EZS28_005503 [Streblomastix strix]|uniref:Ubiquitin-like domain-containing protein n=1 Tax=Streblomastix strix TaxID=222440 RepID=A0A5J4WX86_9EUKA|nr:MAG: hypothetical protein EZS28_005503 [Streblomastix strix]